MAGIHSGRVYRYIEIARGFRIPGEFPDEKRTTGVGVGPLPARHQLDTRRHQSPLGDHRYPGRYPRAPLDSVKSFTWGTGNPGPDYDGAVREGDNLYSDSVVALDADSGELRWYFQFTPHDIHDWDSTQIPILADTMFNGGDAS